MVTWGPTTTSTFGTSTPASTTPTAAAPTGGAFNFGGAAPSTPPLTPQAPAGNPPPLFGGASTPAPAARAPAGGGLFGAAPAPSGGLFGSNPAPAPTTGGLFGTSQAPVPAGGLFGSTPAPASGSLFGSTPAPASGGLFGSSAPAPSGGLFGATAPAPSGGLFGSTPAPAIGQPAQPAQSPHQAAYHAHQSASAQQETARIQEAISNLQAKYSTAAPGAPNQPNSQCAFTAILYDALTGPQREAIAKHSTSGANYINTQMASMTLSATVIPKPPHISQKAWNEAQARNPNHAELTPVALVGASSLHSRLVTQQEKATTYSDMVSQLKRQVESLSNANSSSSRAIRRASLEQEALQRRLLEVMRKAEIVRCMGQPMQQAEREGMDRMERVLRDVNLLMRGVMDVEERGREQSRVWKRKAASGVRSDVDWTLEKEDKAALMEVLNDQRCGLDGLGHIVKRDERDVGILKDEMEKVYNASSGVVVDKLKKAIPIGEGGVAIFTGY